MQSNDYVNLVVELALFLILIAWYKLVKPMAKQWIAQNVDKQVQDIVQDAVCAAEQTIENNAEKKAWVLNTCSASLAKIGVELTAGELDKLIEKTVYCVKNYI